MANHVQTIVASRPFSRCAASRASRFHGQVYLVCTCPGANGAALIHGATPSSGHLNHESAASIPRDPMTVIHCKNRASLFAQLEAEIFTRLSSPTAGSVREFTRIFFADFPTEEIESHNFAMSIGAGSQVGPDLRRHWRGCRSFSFSSS